VYRRLYNIYFDELLSINATAKDVLQEFPTLMGKTGNQIRDEFHHCQMKAMAELANQEGTYFPLANNDVVLFCFVFCPFFHFLLSI
jgi:hypothetical protein